MAVINKVVFGDTVLIDLTEDTVTADQVMAGLTVHLSDGRKVEGTMDLSDYLTKGDDQDVVSTKTFIGTTNGVSFKGSSGATPYKIVADENGNLVIKYGA